MLNYIQIQMVIKMIQFQIHIQMIQMMILIMILIMNLIMILIMATSDNICKVFFHCELFFIAAKVFCAFDFFYSCETYFYSCEIFFLVVRFVFIKVPQVGPCIYRKKII